MGKQNVVIAIGLVLGWVWATDKTKTQFIRLLDVFLVGPLMLAASTQATGQLKAALLVTGAATISFNGRNYLANR